MANIDKRNSVTSNDVREAKENYFRSIREHQITCCHKDKNGPLLVAPSQMSKLKQINIGRELREDDLICSRCGQVVNMESFTVQDLRELHSVLKNMYEQCKVLVALDDDEFEALTNIIRILDDMEQKGVDFYEEHVIKQFVNGKGRNKKNNNQQRAKGKVAPGVGASYNRR